MGWLRGSKEDPLGEMGKVLLSEGYAGLNFKDLELFNQALLAKQVWRILQNPSSLVILVLKGRYFPHCFVLEASCPLFSSFFGKILLR